MVMRTVASGAMLAALAYTIFEPSFVGTWADNIRIFAYGFTLDVGVNSAIEEIRQRVTVP